MLIISKSSTIIKYNKIPCKNIQIHLGIKCRIYGAYYNKKPEQIAQASYIYNKIEIISILLQHQLLLIAS